MKVKIARIYTLLLCLTVAAISLFIGYQAGSDSVPQNCAELGAAYLEIGKKELNITEFESERWHQLIEDETQFTTDCDASLIR